MNTGTPSVAVFGMGCFWEPDDYFSKLKGVARTSAGYMGGTKENPTYEEVCSGTAGHTEVVEIGFDPSQISYHELLSHFWKEHDPLYPAKAQYQSVIFYQNEKQKTEAEESKREIEGKLGKPVVTKILSAEKFWRAEEYHQKYLQKNGLRVCPS